MNAYDDAVGAQVVCTATLTVTDLPGARKRLRSLMTPSAADTVPTNRSWVDVRLRLDGSIVTPAGTERFAEPRKFRSARFLRVIFTVGVVPAQASAAASADASSSGTDGTAVMLALNSFLGSPVAEADPTRITPSPTSARNASVPPSALNLQRPFPVTFPPPLHMAIRGADAVAADNANRIASVHATSFSCENTAPNEGCQRYRVGGWPGG